MKTEFFTVDDFLKVVGEYFLESAKLHDVMKQVVTRTDFKDKLDGDFDSLFPITCQDMIERLNDVKKDLNNLRQSYSVWFKILPEKV